MKFKVGDWVRVVGQKDIEIVNNKNVSIFNNPKKSIFFKHWQPEAGEWCWFYSDVMKLDNVCILRKFTQMEKDIEADDMFGCEPTVPDKEEFESIKVFYKYCEPFIGNLPSFIKEIK